MAALKKQNTIDYIEYNSIEELDKEYKILFEKAFKAANNAYAPYSKFRVGVALELITGEQVIGNNQENIAYPSGMCAERVALYNAAANYPNTTIKTIVIVAENEKVERQPVSPCGACRQVIAEYEKLSGSPICILFLGEKGKIIQVNGISSLLPLQFKME